MEALTTAREELRLAASHVRLLADLMLLGADLQDVDRAAFAHVLQDLAARLDRGLARIDAGSGSAGGTGTDTEGRP